MNSSRISAPHNKLQPNLPKLKKRAINFHTSSDNVRFNHKHGASKKKRKNNFTRIRKHLPPPACLTLDCPSTFWFLRVFSMQRVYCLFGTVILRSWTRWLEVASSAFSRDDAGSYSFLNVNNATAFVLCLEGLIAIVLCFSESEECFEKIRYNSSF